MFCERQVADIKIVSSKGKNEASKNVSSKAKTEVSKKPEKKAKKSKSGVKTAVIIIMVVVLVFAVGTVALGFYVNNRVDVIFPNVSVDGIDLSGLTSREAYDTLRSNGFENNAADVSVTVNFPDGSGFSISGDDAGFSMCAQTATIAAFEHGRNGSFFENMITYIRSMLSETNLSDTNAVQMDRDFVHEEVEAATNRFNSTLFENALDITDDSIIIIKGAGVEPAETESVFELTVETLYKALNERTHLSVEYLPPPASDDGYIDLMALYSVVSVEPVSAVYDPETVSVTQSVTGVTFDMAAAQRQVNGASNGTRIEIPLIFIEPEVTTEYLEGLIFRDVLASTRTDVAGSDNRVNNVTLAAHYVNDIILNPGEVFSFNQTVGQRTAARGFREAPGFADGREVQMMGGGICQVSSAIYNSVIHAGLEVVERRAHGLPISYLPLGQDATVFWNYIDLRFRNNTDFPIRIESITEGRVHTLTLHGTKLDDTRITIERAVTTTTFNTIEQEDPSVPHGTTVVYQRGANGAIVYTFQRLYDGDGNLISRTPLDRSVYRPRNRIVLIPVPSAYEPGDNEPPGPPDDRPPENQLPEQPPTGEPPVNQPPDNQPPADGPPDNQPPQNEPPQNEPPVDEVPPQLPPEPQIPVNPTDDDDA